MIFSWYINRTKDIILSCCALQNVYWHYSLRYLVSFKATMQYTNSRWKQSLYQGGRERERRGEVADRLERQSGSR